ncbi:MAG TPA: ABC transporter permease [Acidobacteriota bacterium]|jgi:putative ABC transport system permease protein|nr:ABC transporter permease [Acidobacteriota bacterium]HNU00710.1 ABC transporter permease [Acidobacteriota bacterium]
MSAIADVPALTEKPDVKSDQTLSGWPVLLEALRMAFESVMAHKLRSLLTLLGVIIGVASVMIVGAFISGLETYVTDNVTDLLGSNTFIVARIAAVDLNQEEFEKRLRTHRDLRWDDYEYIRSRSQHAQEVSIERSTRQDVHYKGLEVLDTTINGITANAPRMSNISFHSGRFFQEFEFSRSLPVCVIGWGVKTELFPNEDPIGREVKIAGRNYRVLGVMTRRGSFLGQNLDNQLYIPASAFAKMFDVRRGWTIRVRTAPGPAFEAAQGEVRTLLRGKHHLSPSQPDDFDILSTDEINQSVGQFTGAIATVVTPITAIALLVGGIVIMNIMLMSVTERTREIGIRKAIGARRRDLLLQFLLESAILGIAGGLLGILLSYSVCYLIEALSDFTLTITPGYIILALAVSGGVGILAGMYPAFKAAKLDPIRALSFES